MPGWDYSRNGYYYITMVMDEWDPILGHIENGEMILSDFGEIAFDEWIKSFELHNLPIAKYNRKNRFWQLNYHDHIIRDDGEYRRIKKYIMDNPKNWKKK